MFSQSIDLGYVGLIKNKCVDKQKKELYVFYTDSVVVFDLVKFSKKSSSKLEYEEGLLGLTICVNSKIYFVQNGGGKLFQLMDNKIVRIDKSFDHKMQINSSIFNYNDTIYKYGGYGFWSYRNFFTYFDKTSSEWDVVSPEGSKVLPEGTQQSIVTIIGDDFYVYGGFKSEKFKPLNSVINNEVWKFNIKTKSWKKIGTTDFDVSNHIVKIPVNNDYIFFNSVKNEGEFFKVDILDNKKTFYKSITFHRFLKDIPFYLDGVFYCYIVKDFNTGEIQLVKRFEDEFLGEKIREEKFYYNNETLHLSIGVLVSLLLISFITFKLLKWNKKRKLIIPSNNHLLYKNRILNFDNKSIRIINLLLNSENELISRDILNITEKTNLNYGHNTRIMNSKIEEINFKLKEILHVKNDLITYKKSKTDKRIKVYTIDKSYFFIKKN
jgi:hypothetical protein